jgi:Homing endonuclease associated repeat
VGCFWATCNVFFKKSKDRIHGRGVSLFSRESVFLRGVLTMPTTKPRGKLPAVKPAAKLSSSKPGSAKTKAKTIIAKPPAAKPCTAKLLTKERVICAIQEAARKLNHGPSGRELRQLSGITASQVARRFGTYRAAVFAAGVKPHQAGVRVEAAILLEDWGRVARKLGRVPSNSEYERAGGYSRVCFTRSFQSWVEVPAAFSRFVASGGLAGDWTDVLEMVREGPMPTCGKCGRLAERRAAVRLAAEAEVRKRKSVRTRLETHPPAAGVEMRQLAAGDEMRQAKETDSRETDPKEIAAVATILPPPLWGKKCVTATMLAVFLAELAPTGLQWITGALFPRRVLQDRPLMGAPTQLPGLAHEPVNEMGVLVLFAMLSRQLGFIVDAVQAAFPDLLARMEVQPGRWQPVRIEVEYLSSSFRRHGHDARQCDLIVCWRHDWKNCPPNLQVLELSKIVKQLGLIG